MKLSSVLGWNGLSVIIKILSLMGVNKVLAYYTGPSSFAYISQLQNVTNLALVLPANSINSATIKYTAELEGDDRKAFLKTCTSIMMIFCVLTSIFFLSFSREISVYVFNSQKYSYIFYVYSFTICFFAINSFLLSFLNGARELKKYVLSNIIGNISTLALSVLLIVNFNLGGALICIVTNQVINALVTFFFVRHMKSFDWRFFIGKMEKNQVKKIFKFSSMAIFAGFILPLSIMFIRNIIINSSGVEDAGIWDATWKLSSIYLMFISTTLSVYYLPVFSRLKNRAELKRELFKGCLFIFIITISSGCLIYIMREFLIEFLFSPSFFGVSKILGWQLIGDSLKMISWVLGYFLIGKACVKYYVGTEIIQWVSFVTFSYVGVNNYGLLGVQYAYVLSQIFYLMVLLFCVRKYMKKGDVFE